MPMRDEMNTRETQSEKTTRLIGEIGTVVAFCLAGLTLSTFIALHLSMPIQFFGWKWMSRDRPSALKREVDLIALQ
jgi:hypothetical protein